MFFIYSTTFQRTLLIGFATSSTTTVSRASTIVSQMRISEGISVAGTARRIADIWVDRRRTAIEAEDFSNINSNNNRSIAITSTMRITVERRVHRRRWEAFAELRVRFRVQPVSWLPSNRSQLHLSHRERRTQSHRQIIRNHLT